MIQAAAKPSAAAAAARQLAAASGAGSPEGKVPHKARPVQKKPQSLLTSNQPADADSAAQLLETQRQIATWLLLFSAGL